MSAKDCAAFFLAVCAYALDGEDKKLSGMAGAVFKAIKPILESQASKAEAGMRGGTNKAQAKRKQNASKNDSATENISSKNDSATENSGEKFVAIRNMEEDTIVSSRSRIEDTGVSSMDEDRETESPPTPQKGAAAEPQGAAMAPNGICQQVMDLYNELCPSLPRCKTMSEARRKAIKARIAGGYGLEDFRMLFSMAEASEFLRGRNGKDWIADFDWLIRDANMAKVLDGKYTASYIHRPNRQTTSEAMTKRVEAGTAALGEFERAAIARMMREGAD